MQGWCTGGGVPLGHAQGGMSQGYTTPVPHPGTAHPAAHGVPAARNGPLGSGWLAGSGWVGGQGRSGPGVTVSSAVPAR